MQTKMAPNARLSTISFQNWQLITLIVLNLVLTLRSEDIQNPDSSIGNLSNEASPGLETRSKILLQEYSNDQDNEVEIEDVDVEGGSSPSWGMFDSNVSPVSEGSVQESENQSGSDPTAIAKVYSDETVPTYVSGTTRLIEDKGTKGVKPSTQTWVACWDYRTMGTYNVTSTPKNSSGVENGTAVEGDTTEEASSSGEETIKITSDNLQEGNETDAQLLSAVDPSNKTVEIVNMTYLLHDVLYSNAALKGRETASNCSVVMFYAPWCPFSAKAAPHFNALPRGYPPLRVAAIDSSKFKNINTYFGILSVPTVVLFHNGKIIAKFNDTSFTLAKFAEFIEYFTDLKHEDRMNVTTKDFDGPLSSVAIKEVDWYLYIAWVFIIFCFFHYISKSVIWRRAVDFVRTAWREAEAQHEHID